MTLSISKILFNDPVKKTYHTLKKLKKKRSISCQDPCCLKVFFFLSFFFFFLPNKSRDHDKLLCVNDESSLVSNPHKIYTLLYIINNFSNSSQNNTWIC